MEKTTKNARAADRPGRSWFLAGSVLTLVTGVLHTAGQFGGTPPPLEAAVAAMHAGKLDMGLGMTPSVFDIFQDLTFTMSVTFFALGTINLIVGLSRETTVTLQRHLALVNVIWLTVFVALNAAYHVPPPLFSGIVVWVAFVVAAGRSTRRD